MFDYRKEYELEETINGIIIAKSKSYQEVRGDRPEAEKDYGTFKYYGLFCWGGFFNKKYEQFHDYRTDENGEFIKYFTSPQDRQEYLEKMQSVESCLLYTSPSPRD